MGDIIDYKFPDPFARFRNPKPTPAPPPAPPPPTPITPTAPGIDPNELANATYGHKIPISAGGKARIGGSIVFGPHLNNGKASFGISFGIALPVNGTRVLFEIALDSKVVWTSAAGTATISAGTFLAETFTARFYQGTLTQSVDALETSYYGSSAVAYRPQMMIFFENLPLALFGGKIPYVAAMIGDTTSGATPSDGINLGTALERIAHSPFGGYSASTFDCVGVTDIVDAMIVSENVNIIDLCKNISQVYQNLDILQSDKLYVRDHGSNINPDITLNLDRVVLQDDPIQITRQEPSSVKRERRVTTIDPDFDYTWVTSQSQRARAPVEVSASVGTEEITLPLVIDANTRQAITTYSQYAQENARKKVSLSAIAYALELEPGDRFKLSSIGDGFVDEIYKCTETVHGANYQVEIHGEAILRCNLPTDPSYTPVSHYESVAQAATYTFTGVDIGTAAADRSIALGIGVMRSLSIGRTITGVTINGIAATIDVQITSGDAFISVNPAITCGIASLLVTSGTTATVAVTLDGAAAGAFIDVFALNNLNSTTPHDTASSGVTGSNPTLTLDIPTNGVTIAAYGGVGGSPGSVVWTGLNTLNSNERINTTSPMWWGSTASQGSMAAETGRTIALTTPATGYEALVAASWA